jgi:hypothetical protein
MKKTISTYWPVAILLPIVLTFCMHARESGDAVLRQQPGVVNVSAELARAISLGFVDDDEAAPAVIATQKTL